MYGNFFKEFNLMVRNRQRVSVNSLFDKHYKEFAEANVRHEYLAD
jgi:hypothetical protein